MKKAKRRSSALYWSVALLLLAGAVWAVWWSHNRVEHRTVAVSHSTRSAVRDSVVSHSSSSSVRDSASEVAKGKASQSEPIKPVVGRSSSKAPRPIVAQRSGFEPVDGGVTDSMNIVLPRWDPSEPPIYNRVGRYWFVYLPGQRSARWVAYKLVRGDVGQGAGRSSSFTADPLLAARGLPSASNGDYSRSGYDKGHLLPSADRSISVNENRETFRFSNIAPQSPALNRGPWRLLEEELRRQATRYDTIYVVVGSLLDSAVVYPASAAAHDVGDYGAYRRLRVAQRSIGDGVAVPRLFYKVVALRRGDDFEPMAFLFGNDLSMKSDNYSHYAVTVDSLERLTGLDFFPSLSGF